MFSLEFNYHSKRTFTKQGNILRDFRFRYVSKGPSNKELDRYEDHYLYLTRSKKLLSQQADFLNFLLKNNVRLTPKKYKKLVDRFSLTTPFNSEFLREEDEVQKLYKEWLKQSDDNKSYEGQFLESQVKDSQPIQEDVASWILPSKIDLPLLNLERKKTKKNLDLSLGWEQTLGLFLGFQYYQIRGKSLWLLWQFKFIQLDYLISWAFDRIDPNCFLPTDSFLSYYQARKLYFREMPLLLSHVKETLNQVNRQNFVDARKKNHDLKAGLKSPEIVKYLEDIVYLIDSLEEKWQNHEQGEEDPSFTRYGSNTSAVSSIFSSFRNTAATFVSNTNLSSTIQMANDIRSGISNRDPSVLSRLVRSGLQATGVAETYISFPSENSMGRTVGLSIDNLSPQDRESLENVLSAREDSNLQETLRFLGNQKFLNLQSSAIENACLWPFILVLNVPILKIPLKKNILMLGLSLNPLQTLLVYTNSGELALNLPIFFQLRSYKKILGSRWAMLCNWISFKWVLQIKLFFDNLSINLFKFLKGSILRIKDNLMSFFR